jgi:hypothetical protein
MYIIDQSFKLVSTPSYDKKGEICFQKGGDICKKGRYMIKGEISPICLAIEIKRGRNFLFQVLSKGKKSNLN